MTTRSLRSLDIAMATLALRTSATRPPERERQLVPAVDEPGAPVLDRVALDQECAALIASLWPPARQCVIAPLYQELPAPAVFGALYKVSWAAPPVEDARALQGRLRQSFH